MRARCFSGFGIRDSGFGIRDCGWGIPSWRAAARRRSRRVNAHDFHSAGLESTRSGSHPKHTACNVLTEPRPAPTKASSEAGGGMHKSLIIRVRASSACGRSGAFRRRGAGKMAPLRPEPCARTAAQVHDGKAAISAEASAASLPEAIDATCSRYQAHVQHRSSRGLHMSSPASKQSLSPLRAPAARRVWVCTSVAIATDAHPVRGTATRAGTGMGEFARAGHCTTASGLFDATRERGMGHPAG
jgi:hypothetical protein